MSKQLTFAISDVHGRDDLLEEAIKQIENRAGETGGRLVVIGDMVDRGPYSAQVVARLRAGPQLPNWEWIVLKGNHEELFCHHAYEGSQVTWLIHGGYETLLSYGANPDDMDSWDTTQFKRDALWLDKLPMYFMDDHRIFVHTAINPHMPLEHLTSGDMMWNRQWEDLDVPWIGGKYVVHGHIPNKDGPYTSKNKVNIDTKAFKTGRLTVAVFDDTQAAPIDWIFVQGPTIKEYRKATDEQFPTLKKWLKSKGLKI